MRWRGSPCQSRDAPTRPAAPHGQGVSDGACGGLLHASTMPATPTTEPQGSASSHHGARRVGQLFFRRLPSNAALTPDIVKRTHRISGTVVKVGDADGLRLVRLQAWNNACSGALLQAGI